MKLDAILSHYVNVVRYVAAYSLLILLLDLYYVANPWVEFSRDMLAKNMLYSLFAMVAIFLFMPVVLRKFSKQRIYALATDTVDARANAHTIETLEGELASKEATIEALQRELETYRTMQRQKPSKWKDSLQGVSLLFADVMQDMTRHIHSDAVLEKYKVTEQDFRALVHELSPAEATPLDYALTSAWRVWPAQFKYSEGKKPNDAARKAFRDIFAMRLGA